jgi:hypothetical protein
MNPLKILLIVVMASILIFTGCSQDNSDNIVNGRSVEEGSLAPDSSTGLFAHWSFLDDSETQLIDSSAYTLDGVIHGATRTVEDGHVALKFDGEDDYVKMEAMKGENLRHISKLGDGSISVWFKLNSLPQGKRIYPIFYYGSSGPCDFFDAANKGLIIEIGHHPVQYNSMRLYFTLWANGCTYHSFCYDSNHAMELGKWYHFVAVVGEDYNTGYLNGEEMTDRRYNFNDERASQFFENAVAHEALWLGRGYWDSTMNYFDGFIGDVRIYADALSLKQVKELYLEILDK